MAEPSLMTPQSLLQGNGLAASHLKFLFRADATPSAIVVRPGPLSETAIVGDDDPAVDGIYARKAASGYGAASGITVVGMRPKFCFSVDASTIPPPRESADVLTMQLNLIPLDQLGKTPPRAVEPAPGELIWADQLVHQAESWMRCSVAPLPQRLKSRAETAADSLLNLSGAV